MKRKGLSATLIDTAKDLKLSKITVEQLEALNIPSVEDLTASEIRKIREKIKVSQGVFAAILNVASSTVHKWERGTARPHAAALRLLKIIDTKGIDVISA